MNNMTKKNSIKKKIVGQSGDTKYSISPRAGSRDNIPSIDHSDSDSHAYDDGN